MSAIQVASMFGVINLRDNMTSGLNSALNNARGFGTQITSLGDNIQNMGTRMTAATAPISAGLLTSIRQSQTFNRSMSNINSILGITGDEAAILRQQLLDYGGSTVAGPQAVAEAYYQIVSGVADASTHMAILEAATATSEAGQADLMATTSALISTMNSYGLQAEDAAYISDVYTRTVQTGVLTMDELASAMPQVTGLASSMNIGIEDLAGQMSYLTTQGFSASNSATFLRSMMTTLLNPTTALSEAIGDMGYESGQAMVDALGLVGAYDAIREFGGGAFDGLITNQEALQGALALTGDSANQFLNDFGEGVEGATAAAREIQNETATWDLFTSALQRTAIAAGDALAPALLTILNDNIIPLVDRVGDWIADNPRLATTILQVAGAVTVLGPVLFVVGGIISTVGTAVTVITGGIGLLIPVVTGASAAFTAAGGGVAGLGAAIYAALGPFGMIILAVGGLVAWMSGRDGGLIGSLNDARNSAIMLATLGLWAVNTAAQNAINLFNQLKVMVDEASAAVGNFVNDRMTTLNQLGTLISNPGATLNVLLGNGGGQSPAPDGERYAGGPVTAGRTYLTGEKGPELFTPSTSGRISSNRDTVAAMNGSGGDTFNFYGNIIAPEPETFMQTIEERRRRRS